jgi:hypothetical protein
MRIIPKSQLAQLSTRIASSTVGAHHCWTFLGHLGLRENLEKCHKMSIMNDEKHTLIV